MKIIVTVTTEGDLTDERTDTKLVIARLSKPIPAAKVLMALEQLYSIGYKLLEDKAMSQLPKGTSMEDIKAALYDIKMADIMWPMQEQSEN